MDYETRIKKIEDLLDKIAKEHGSLANNLGDVAEETFYTGLERSKRLGMQKFTKIARNVRDFKGNEYDIVLMNGSAVAVLEVKHKIHPSDVDEFVGKIIPAFRTSYPQYKDFKLYGGLAGMAFPTSAREAAEKHGLFVLTQNGQNIKLANSVDFKPKSH
jgi:hypothetical protein